MSGYEEHIGIVIDSRFGKKDEKKDKIDIGLLFDDKPRLILVKKKEGYQLPTDFPYIDIDKNPLLEKQTFETEEHSVIIWSPKTPKSPEE